MNTDQGVAKVSTGSVKYWWPWLGAALFGLLVAISASAQDKVSIEKVHFKVVDAFERGALVVGELHVPDTKGERLPAVMIVNSSPGFDGRSAFYAEALNRAGIATLELDFMQGRGIPASPRDHMAHAYQSLLYLAQTRASMAHASGSWDSHGAG